VLTCSASVDDYDVALCGVSGENNNCLLDSSQFLLGLSHYALDVQARPFIR
jgi:hypothetical protein